jgi:hypothetical protein
MRCWREETQQNMTFKLPNQAMFYALYAAYVILLRTRMKMGESMSPKPVTENTLFYGDNLMERYGCY